jgi:serine/threonine protein kinase
VLKALFKQLMEAVAHCHQNGVAHRDIKPENILIDTEGCVRLADFGLARIMRGANSKSVQGEGLTKTITSQWYRAPEVYLGISHYTESVDIWSAGCVLGKLLGDAGDVSDCVYSGNVLGASTFPVCARD